MPLPKLEQKLTEESLSRFCESRVPSHLRDKIRMGFHFRATTALIYETRPSYFDVSKWIEHPVAKFRYHLGARHWTLFWCDRNQKWHLYNQIKPAKSLQTLLDEVTRDPTHIFWG